jgi:hypothetical protein
MKTCCSRNIVAISKATSAVYDDSWLVKYMRDDDPHVFCDLISAADELEAFKLFTEKHNNVTDTEAGSGTEG